MATCKFNVGDKVRRINYDNGGGDSAFKKGAVGKVVNIDEDGYVAVKINGRVNEGNDPANLELVDTETFKFKIGDRVKVVNPAHNFKNKYRDTEFIIKSYNPNGKNTFNEPHYGVGGTFVWQESELELVEKTHKFKVGDMVIGNSSERYVITKKGWIGKVTEVYESSIRVRGNWDGIETSFSVDPQYFDLYLENKTEEKTEEKIVITHDGKTTTATLYREDGSKVTATAKCSPEDTFDFNVGSKLAMERLMDKVNPPEWRVVNRKPKVGDYIRLKRCDYDFDHIGDILKADAVTNSGLVKVYEKNHPNKKNKTHPSFEWNYTSSEYEVVEKVTGSEPKKPEPPKYYNGKVVCISNSLNDGEFTVGKVYEIKNGKFTDNKGNIRPRNIEDTHVTTPDDLKCGYFSTWFYKFIPVVE